MSTEIIAAATPHLETVTAFLELSPDRDLVFLVRNEQLLSDEALAAVNLILASVLEDEDYHLLKIINARKLLLHRCRILGIESAIQERDRQFVAIRESLSRLLQLPGFLPKADLLRRDKTLLTDNACLILEEFVRRSAGMPQEREVRYNLDVLNACKDWGREVAIKYFSRQADEQALEGEINEGWQRFAELVFDVINSRTSREALAMLSKYEEGVRTTVVERMMAGLISNAGSLDELTFLEDRIALFLITAELGIEEAGRSAERAPYSEREFIQVDYSTNPENAPLLGRKLNSLLSCHSRDEAERFLLEHSHSILSDAAYKLRLRSVDGKDSGSFAGMAFCTVLRACRDYGVSRGLAYLCDAEENPVRRVLQFLLKPPGKNTNELDLRENNLYIATRKVFMDLDTGLDPAIILGTEKPSSPNERAAVRRALVASIASCLLRRYTATGNMEDLREALSYFELPAGDLDTSSPESCRQLGGYARSLFNFYKATGQHRALAIAQELLERAYDLALHFGTHIADVSFNLATVLTVRAAETQDEALLERAVSVLERAQEHVADKVESYYLDYCRAYIYRSLRHVVESPLNYSDDSVRRYLEASKSEAAVWQKLEPHAEELPREIAAAMYYSIANLLLHGHYGRPDRSQYRKYLEKAFAAGREIMRDLAMNAARLWAVSALREELWDEAIRANEAGLELLEESFEAQLFNWDREVWLRKQLDTEGVKRNLNTGVIETFTLESNNIYVRQSFALCKVGRYRDAVVILERGRTLLLEESFQSTAIKLDERRRAAKDASLDMALARLKAHSQEWLERSRLVEQSLSEGFLRPRADTDEARNKRVAMLNDLDRIKGAGVFADVFKKIDFADISSISSAHGKTIIYLSDANPIGFALLIDNSGDVNCVWLSGFNQTQLAIRFGAYMNAYRRMHLDMQEWGATLELTCYWLGKVVFEPLEPFLEQSKSYVIVPCGRAGLLPVHAAMREESAADSGRLYAMDRYAISFSPSAKSLLFSQRVAESVKANGMLAVSNPTSKVNSPLSTSRLETLTAASYFRPAQILAGDAASKLNILESMEKFPVFHFSCHGRYSASEPLQSCLFAADDEQITLGELLTREPKRTRLVVLAACETGLFDDELPDEVLNMGSAFLQYGSAGVISTLWPIHDMPSMLLLSKFYGLWIGTGIAPPEALRRAQVWLKDATRKEICEFLNESDKAMQQRYSNWPSIRKQVKEFGITGNSSDVVFGHPIYWAGFIYYGV